MYQNSFNIQDHREIAEIVSQLNYPWIVTYDNVDEIISLYNFTEYQTYQLTYTVEKIFRNRSDVLSCKFKYQFR